ncbi:hypothetical protein K438DRAFT_1768344 [Mycena galopus ATCC 62051]|nr:hypothetical protein K438DRAFT_1768344 [Mycena galopus ATCC 62051]
MTLSRANAKFLIARYRKSSASFGPTTCSFLSLGTPGDKVFGHPDEDRLYESCTLGRLRRKHQRVEPQDSYRTVIQGWDKNPPASTDIVEETGTANKTRGTKTRTVTRESSRTHAIQLLLMLESIFDHRDVNRGRTQWKRFRVVSRSFYSAEYVKVGGGSSQDPGAADGAPSIVPQERHQIKRAMVAFPTEDKRTSDETDAAEHQHSGYKKLNHTPVAG